MTTPTPTPPTNSFASDNAAGVDPAVLDALAAANVGPALAYGEDPWTARASSAMDELFGRRPLPRAAARAHAVGAPTVGDEPE